MTDNLESSDKKVRLVIYILPTVKSSMDKIRTGMEVVPSQTDFYNYLMALGAAEYNKRKVVNGQKSEGEEGEGEEAPIGTEQASSGVDGEGSPEADSGSKGDASIDPT